MYSPKHFKMDDPSVMRDFIRAHPLATVVQNTAEGLQANHIPLQLVEAEAEAAGEHEWRLRGHVARANAMWQDALVSPEVLLIFTGADAYVSPNWYPSKALDGKAVPTWNYAVLHVRGVLDVHDDVDWLRGALQDLTAEHEAQVGEQPWQISDAPADYIARMLQAVVGIEVRITSMEAKFKVSQNQSADNRAGVVAGMGAVGDEVHERMVELIKVCAPK